MDDFKPGPPSIPTDLELERLLASEIKETQNGRQGAFKGFRLETAFQPIFSLAHRRPVGYEGLLRSWREGKPISPAITFAAAESTEESIHLDRIARLLHLANFTHLDSANAWLFLNVDPNVVLSARQGGSHFTSLVAARFGLPPERIVVEILEKEIEDEDLLAHAVADYKKKGFLVALDDFGAGQSNFDRIWRLKPDIVKLDRSLVANAVKNRRAGRIFPSLVALLHEAGSLVLVEGIETEAEAMAVMDSDADFVQGFHFSRPAPVSALPDPSAPAVLEEMTDVSRTRALGEDQSQTAQMADILAAYRRAAEALEKKVPLHWAVEHFLNRPAILRCFLLDERGVQMGPNITAAPATDNAGRFAVLNHGEGADWSRRAYFRRALARPGEAQVTGPYLSLPDADACITLSMALKVGERARVLCADLRWRGAAHLITGSSGILPRPQSMD